MNNGQHRERCLERLVWATQKLQISVDHQLLEKTADLIIETMTGPWRYFHTPDHTFTVGGQDDPIEVLAALFHDIVYVQVDQGMSLNLSYHLAPFIREVNGQQLQIREASDLPHDFVFELVSLVFGFVPGQILSPLNGQNEFLSTLVGNKVFERFLSPALLLQIAACIEATIPFRAKNTEGLSASEVLYQRLVNANQKFNLGLTEADLVTTVKRSVRLGNRDVENFASENSALFLDNTWSLIPETNHDLKKPSSYTVREYRTAMQKMEGFMGFLKPELVFHQFGNVPDDETFQGLIERARKNIEIARLYLGAKLVSIAVLEAISFRLGRNLPISTLMGELPAPGFSADVLSDFLPIPQDYEPAHPYEQEVLVLLEKGRSEASDYDLKNSPLATFIVKSVGFTETRRLLQEAKKFFQKMQDAEEKKTVFAEEFLAECSGTVVKPITKALIELLERRKVALVKTA